MSEAKTPPEVYWVKMPPDMPWARVGCAGTTVLLALDEDTDGVQLLITPGQAAALARALTEAITHTVTWDETFPDGRTIYYEGDDPEGFREIIRGEFGFDPADAHGRNGLTGQPDPGSWGEWNPGEDGGDGYSSYSFHCPAEHLDAIYASGRFPMGS